MANAMVQVGNTKINPNLVDEKLIDEAIKGLGGLSLKEDSSLRERVKKLGDEITEKIDEVNLCSCARCGAPNDARDPRCPFCGNVDGAEVVVSKADVKEIAKEYSSAGEAYKKAKADAKKNGGAAREPRAIEKPGASEMVKADEARLDEAVARILGMKDDWHAQGYRLGKEIGALIENGLWKSRSKAGKSVHKKFGDFCQKELGISDVHAKKLSDCAAEFDEKTFTKLGHNKLFFLLALPSGQRQEVADAIPADATVSQVRQKRDQLVREYEEEHGEAPARARGPRVSPGKAKGADAANLKKKPRKVEAPERSEVTVALVLGKGTKVYFFQGKEEGAKPATVNSFRKQKVAYGAYEPKNKVLVRVELREADDGQLYVVEKAKRA